jgi:hypothetical protein
MKVSNPVSLEDKMVVRAGWDPAQADVFKLFIQSAANDNLTIHTQRNSGEKNSLYADLSGLPVLPPIAIHRLYFWVLTAILTVPTFSRSTTNPTPKNLWPSP